MRRLRGALAALVIGPATALVIIGVAVALLLNPVWVSMGQDRAEAGVLTGYGPEDLRTATGAILADLVFGPPDFDDEVAGEPVLTERERGHMRDVRNVFLTLYATVAVAALVLLVAVVLRRRSPSLWRRVARGGRALAVVTLVGGLIGLVFFDAAFELFHRVFFPAGSYTFDPESERLVQLFPNPFWVETTIALGALLILIGAFVASWAGNRARVIEARAAATTAPARWTRRVPVEEAAAEPPAEPPTEPPAAPPAESHGDGGPPTEPYLPPEPRPDPPPESRTEPDPPPESRTEPDPPPESRTEPAPRPAD